MNRFTIASAVLGFALIVAGLTWVYRPLGPIAAGLLLLAAAHGSLRQPPAPRDSCQD
jgi:hypothetical protein